MSEAQPEQFALLGENKMADWQLHTTAVLDFTMHTSMRHVKNVTSHDIVNMPDVQLHRCMRNKSEQHTCELSTYMSRVVKNCSTIAMHLFVLA